MPQRFWRPDEPVDTGHALYLVGGVESSQRLYLILEGPPLPPPKFPGDPDDDPEMLVVRVFAASGVELIGAGGTGDYGKAGWRPRMYVLDAALPAEPGPLTVSLHRFDGSIIWQTQITAVHE